jgi:hypothetical protein
VGFEVADAGFDEADHAAAEHVDRGFERGGGGAGGGGSTSPDSSTSSTGSSGIPVAPSFTARIDSIGVVPTAMYYGTPSQWTIGGYVFEANYLTHLKATNGPLVVGACVSVTFSTTYTGAYLASEIKSELPSRCGG